MIRNASFRRKVIYLAAMIPILAALAYLGLPATGTPGSKNYNAGGKLARLRTANDLSQANLGEIDPAGETMKLATLGLRPVATNLLWDKANEYKKVEAWDALSATLNQITKLQPNFVTVWEFQAHNLSYNVSVEFDDYRQRYHWVKKGIEFLLVGTTYNKREPKLPWNLGWFTGQKIGRADEKVQFRRMFQQDTDFHAEFGSYVAIDSPEAIGADNLHPDNWKVARLWYNLALGLADDKNAKASDLNLWRQMRGKMGGQIEAEGQKGRSPLIFQADPAMSLINYASTIQEEGRVGEVAQIAWLQAGKGWDDFGHRPVRSSWGQSLLLYSAEENKATIGRLTEELDALTLGERQKLYDERLSKLTSAERDTVGKADSEMKPEQYQDYMQAQQKMRISHAEVAEQAPEGSRPKARRLATRIFDLELLVERIGRYRQIVNFEYWKTRCEAESRDECVRARRLMYDAHQLYVTGVLTGPPENPGAKELYNQAWADWEKVFGEYPALLDGVTAQDLLDPIRRYRVVLEQLGEDFPADFPLQKILDINQERGRTPAPAKPPEKPAGEKPAGGKPASEQPDSEKTASDKPSSDKPAPEQPNGDTPKTESPAPGKPAPTSPDTKPAPEARPDDKAKSQEPPSEQTPDKPAASKPEA